MEINRMARVLFNMEAPLFFYCRAWIMVKSYRHAGLWRKLDSFSFPIFHILGYDLIL